MNNSRVTDPIPAQPFMRFLEDQVAIKGIERVADELGWSKGTGHADAGPRRLYRYRYGRSETRTQQVNGVRGKTLVRPASVFSRAVVEDALHHAGVDLSDVYAPERYPALYEDIPLEPEAWCPSCQDSCTPIHGECPWCDWSFRDRGAAA